MPDSKVISRGQDVITAPTRGCIAWSSQVGNSLVFRQRPKYLKAYFDDLYIRRIGPAKLLRTGKASSVLTDLDYNAIHAHSLAVELKYNLASAQSRVDRLASDAMIDTDLPEIRIEGPAYSVCNEGAATWGHWIGHNLPRAMLFLQHVPHGRVIIPEAYTTRSKTFGELLFRAGISPSQIVSAPHRCSMIIEDCALVDLPYLNGVFHPILADQIKLLSSSHSSSPPQRKYMPRSSSDRAITNSEELDAIHEEYQIQKASSDYSTLVTQVSAWSDCSVMVSVLGSDLTNMAIGRPEAVCSITPYWFGDIFFYGLSSILGIQWNELYCGTMDTHREPEHRSTFRVQAKEYKEFLKWFLG
jgi:hypothetical protein